MAGDGVTKWYVVEAFEGKDFDVCLRLAKAGYNVWRPVDEVKVSRRFVGKRMERIVRSIRRIPRFGRYLFVQTVLTDAIHSAIKQTPGVFGFVCMAGGAEPAELPAELIEFYRTNAPQRSRKKSGIRPTDIVRILSGPFADFNARVIEVVDKRETLKIEISIFGRPTPLIIEVGHVALVEQGRRPPIKPNVKAHSSLQRA
ncbi:MAG: hypothetical protein CTY36_00325 [Methylocystis sp.]|nr:MAG: hypothetical protein CTY36_00325 [Methylocystis sp.]